eukprot:CAMPEP_0197419360 /NCGR_PEP_ID=MMETSP1170-20131217/4875_1 /TAXON_ID=54406 /ORGANISM="Sarcinochrysis sp, Strain CCMP770" /LENGTH=207 /DNA_ID=CAMNT_0042946455 /DNA_START=9 /DNA_END=630 /DNA_ORIENTATION=+
MDAGDEIRFPRKAEQLPGQIPGDVIVTLRQKPHPRFTRKGNDLHMDLVITLKEALLGFSKSFDHFDGHKVVVANPKISKPGEVKRIAGEGMPVKDVPSERGDLYVKLQFKMPADLTADQKALVEQLFVACFLRVAARPSPREDQPSPSIIGTRRGAPPRLPLFLLAPRRRRRRRDLGHGIPALGARVLRELARDHEADGGLDLSRRQ